MDLPKKAAVVLLIVFVSFAVYFNTFQHPFLFDDQGQIVRNQGIKDFQNLRSFFSPDYFSVFDENSYRPVSTLRLMVQYSLWGLNPTPWRISLVAVYILTVWMVYRLARWTGLGTAAALTGALLFATHPVHAEPMNSLIFGYEIFALAFTLGAFLLYLRGRDSGSPYKYFWLAGSLLAFLAGLGSKENTLILPLLILLWEASRGEFKPFRFSFLRPSLPYFIVLIPYLPLIFTFFHNPKAYGEYPGGSIGTAILLAPVFFVQDLGLLLIPLPSFLTVEHTFPAVQNPFAPVTLIYWAALGLILWVWVWSYRQSKTAFVTIGWILISFLPVSNLVPLSQYSAERYLTFMSAGWALLIGHLFKTAAGRLRTAWGRRAVWFIAGLCVVLYGFGTVQRNTVWASPLTLWTDASQKAPQVMRPHYNLAAAYFETGRFEDAVRELQEAIRIEPDYATAYNSLGYTYTQMKRYDSAVDSFKAAVNLRGNFLEAIGNLGITYGLMGRFQEARDQFQKALEIDPSYAPARNGLDRVTEILKKTGKDGPSR